MPGKGGGRGKKGGGGKGGGRGGGKGGGDKKSALWDALRVQKLAAVRYGLANAGVMPASRNHEGLTTFLLCARDGLDKSLAEMIRWYERRVGELHRCLSQQTNDTNRTSLALACAGGHASCVKLLLDAAASVDRDGSFLARQLQFKDATGKTPHECGSAAVKEVIDDFTYEESDDDDDDAADGSSEALTSTQLSRLKKLALREAETGQKAGEGGKAADGADGDGGVAGGGGGGAAEERGDLPSEMPAPRWPEVAAWAESIKQLRPICELKIERADAGGAAEEPGGAAAAAADGEGGGEEESSDVLDTSIDAVLVEAPQEPPEDGAGPAPPPPPPTPASSSSSSSSSSSGGGGGGGDADAVDPALWYCHTVNRLELKLPGALTFLRADGLARLSSLTTLILAGNSALRRLPDGVLGDLPLKFLDASHCALEALPEALPHKTLETLDVSFNSLAALGPGIAACAQLVTVAVDGNALESLGELPFENLGRLVGLTASGNQLAELDPRAGLATKLERIILSSNPLVAVPPELAACKKLKEIKIDGCPVKDSKVKKYIEKDEIKNLLKYLEKQAPSGGGGGGGGKGKKGKKK